MRLTKACLVGFAVAFVLGCKSEPAPKRIVTVGIATWAGFAPGYVGVANGLFDGLDVRIQVLDDARARQAAFSSGKLDVMISSADLFAQENARGIHGSVFLVTDQSFGGDGIVASSKITSVRQLAGKRVAFTRGGPSDYFLYKTLEANGLRIGNLSAVAVDDPSRAGEVFLSGSVDAAVTWEPFLSNVAKSGKGHILTTTKDLPGAIVDILAGSEEFTADTASLQRFISGWLASVEWLRSHDSTAVAQMAQGLGLKPDDVRGMLAGLQLADRATNERMFSSSGSSGSPMNAILRDASLYWQQSGIIPKGASEPRVAAGTVSFFGRH